MSHDPDPDGTRTKAYQRLQEELERGNLQTAQLFATLLLEEAVRDLSQQVGQAAHSISTAIMRSTG